MNGALLHFIKIRTGRCQKDTTRWCVARAVKEDTGCILLQTVQVETPRKRNWTEPTQKLCCEASNLLRTEWDRPGELCDGLRDASLRVWTCLTLVYFDTILAAFVSVEWKCGGKLGKVADSVRWTDVILNVDNERYQLKMIIRKMKCWRHFSPDLLYPEAKIKSCRPNYLSM